MYICLQLILQIDVQKYKRHFLKISIPLVPLSKIQRHSYG